MESAWSVLTETGESHWIIFSTAVIARKRSSCILLRNCTHLLQLQYLYKFYGVFTSLNYAKWMSVTGVQHGSAALQRPDCCSCPNSCQDRKQKRANVRAGQTSGTPMASLRNLAEKELNSDIDIFPFTGMTNKECNMHSRQKTWHCEKSMWAFPFFHTASRSSLAKPTYKHRSSA